MSIYFMKRERSRRRRRKRAEALIAVKKISD
jgi:hypothetical protein